MARGPAPDDLALFGADARGGLRTALAELCWLLDRGYAETSALKLVGDRHELRARQRTAVLRCACTLAQREHRATRRVAPSELRGRDLAIDGFNVLIAVEVALGGGVLLRGRDGAVRDMASIHGSYRRGPETLAACEAIGEVLVELEPASVLWLLDRPVSNSGRLRAALVELAAARAWPWTVELDYDPDRRLAAFAGVSATGDAWILDHAPAHVDLAWAVVAARCPGAWLLDLGLAEAEGPG